jgi:rod shape-determining protein MreD
MPNTSSAAWVVGGSILLAMILRILPLPQELFVLNPDWILLFLIYWNMALPERVGVGINWFAGLFTDVLTGRMLGQHALAYAVIGYLCLRLHRQLRLYPLYQQALSVLVFLLFSQVMIFWTQNIKAHIPATLAYWYPSMVGALLWPPIFVTLRHVRRHFNIS